MAVEFSVETALPVAVTSPSSHQLPQTGSPAPSNVPPVSTSGPRSHVAGLPVPIVEEFG